MPAKLCDSGIIFKMADQKACHALITARYPKATRRAAGSSWQWLSNGFVVAESWPVLTVDGSWWLKMTNGTKHAG